MKGLMWGVLLLTSVSSTLSIAQEGNGNSVAHGKEVFERWCAACHAPGKQYPGTLALQAKYQGALPAALEERSDLTPELIAYFVRNGVSIMPFFRKTEISDADLEALAHYLKK